MGEGGGEMRQDRSALYDNIVYIKSHLSDIDFFLEESKWQKTIDEAEEAISTLKQIQEYAMHKRNEALETYCKAHPDYIPF
jgi:hypothetical protein